MLTLTADSVALATALPPPTAAGAAVTELPPFEALYREHFDFVWRLLARFGVPRRDQEDQLQEVFKVVHVTRARRSPPPAASRRSSSPRRPPSPYA